MTKRVIAGLALIAVALTASCVLLHEVKKTGQSLIGCLEEAAQRYGENGDYKTPLEKAQRLWNERRDMLGVILKHSDADEIEKYFYQIARYLSTGETKELFEAVEDCRAAIEVMLRGEDPAARNIF